jgi:hypothetical protein
MKPRVKSIQGKYLCGTFPIQNGLKQGDALTPLLFDFILEHVIRKALSFLFITTALQNICDYASF